MLVKVRNENKEKFNHQFYVVYAFHFFKGIGLYILEPDWTDCPVVYSLEDFEVIDNRLSKYFCIGNDNMNYGVKDFVPICTFKEWVDNPYFWNELFNNSEYTPIEYQDVDYKGIFFKYKKLMDYEFFNPNLLDVHNMYKLVILDKNLVMCYRCEYAWEVETTNEMLLCPKCNQVHINPLSNIPYLTEQILLTEKNHHAHFEAYDKVGGTVVENARVIINPTK